MKSDCSFAANADKAVTTDSARDGVLDEVLVDTVAVTRSWQTLNVLSSRVLTGRKQMNYV